MVVVLVLVLVVVVFSKQKMCEKLGSLRHFLKGIGGMYEKYI